MIRKFIVVLVVFINVFLTQSQVWGVVKDADKIQNVISADNFSFFSKDTPAAILSNNIVASENNSGMWIASIFITGLGQILMGEIWRGLKFLLIDFLIFIVPYTIFSIMFGTGFLQTLLNITYTAPYILVLMIAGMIAVYVWNLFDAYNMSQEINSTRQSKEKQLKKLEDQLISSIEIIKRIKIYDNSNISFKAFTF